MITVDYFGRSGNQLFQYVFARILCERYGMDMYSRPPQGLFIPLNNYNTAKIKGDGNSVLVTDTDSDHYLDGEHVLAGCSHMHLHGYFQKSWYYNSYRDIIRNKIFNLKPVEVKKNYDDIVIHLRLTDYFWRRVNSVISPDWYASIVNSQSYKKCYVVVEDHPTNKKYLQHIRMMIKNTEIITGNKVVEDFNFIRSFDRIVCSNSTFCWWAALLSDASKIWTFKRWMNRVVHPAPDLAGMTGAIEVDGNFYTDRELAVKDWTDYWNR